jgi:subtilisin family serine protease
MRTNFRSSVFTITVLATLTTMLPSVGSTSDGTELPNPELGFRIQQEGLGSLAVDTFVAGEVIVRFEPGAPASDRAAAHASIGATVKRNMLLPGAQLLTLPPGLTVRQAVQRLEANPNVAYAEPNHIRQLAAAPDDPLFGDLWGLDNTGQTVNGTAGTADADIDAVEAWDITQGSTDVLVGIIDSGIAYDHPDLLPNLWSNPGETGGGQESNGIDDDSNGRIDDWRGWDFVNDDNDPRDASGHGSHVAGTIGARGNNTTGVTGVAPQVAMVMAQACDRSGCPTAAIVDAFMYVAGLGARIANASLGGTELSAAERDAIAANPNTLYVVAAGNSASDVDADPHYPCAYDLANILCVSATDADDELASFSNFGATHVDVSAPGVNTLSTNPSFTTRFSDDFESGFGSWITGGTNNSWGIDVCTVGGLHCLIDSPGGLYANDTDSWAQTVASIDVSTDVTECSVDYPLGLEMDSSDGLFVEASTDQAGWTILDAWTGSTLGSFLRISTPVDGSIGSPIFLRYRLLSDDTVPDDGAYILSVDVRCVDTTSTTYEFLSGTSMAAPHVTGTAALLQAVDPTITAAEMKVVLMDTVDSIAGLSGTSVTGGRLNAHSAVLALNEAPVGVDDAYGTDEDSQLVVAAAGVLGNDTDADGDVLSVGGSDAASVEGGVVSVAGDGSFTYDPPVDFNGSDTFTYTVSDGALTDTATVTVTVASVDDPPVGVDDAYGTVEDSQLVVAAPGVLGNDTDADGDVLSVSGFDAASVEGGVVSVAGDGSFTYDPPLDFNGSDTFSYTVSDGALTDTATVTITVSPPPPPGGGGGGGGGGGVPPPAPETCPDTLEDPGFVDLDGLSAEAHDAVTCLVAYDITQGTSATTFSPLLEVTRWQMALFLTRQVTVHGLSLPAAEVHGFTDIAALPQATQDAINQLASLEVTAGTSPTTFDPTSSVKRWQMALFLMRFANLVEIPLTASPPDPFADIAFLSAEGRLAINQLAAAGIAKGTSGTTFDPLLSVTRWQMALFLTRVLTADGVTLE